MMYFNRVFAASVLAVSALCPLSASAAVDPNPITSAPLQVAQTTQVPGHQLKVGSYAIAVLDRLSDRMVIRVTDSNGKEEATFIGLPGGSRLAGQGSEGPISMTAQRGSKIALRGFTFPNGIVAEFVYPKDEAVALAKANSITIPAVDPASEGRPATPDMSRTDMEMVTLWMLTPTFVGKDQPGIEAKRYQDTAEAHAGPASATPTAQTVQRAAPVQVAQATPPGALPAPRAKPVSHPIAALPHTASNDPLILFAGVIALLFAGQIRLGLWLKRGRS